jgi:hypothetical protein
MNKKNEINDELKKLSPFLSEIKKENVFKVPENYFKTLPDKVLEQIQTTTNTSEERATQPGWMERLIENIAVLFQPKYAAGFATALILVIATVYFIQKPTDSFDGSYSSVNQYVSDNIDEFDAEMLWEASVFESGENIIDEQNDNNNIDEYFEEIIDDLDDSELEKLL